MIRVNPIIIEQGVISVDAIINPDADPPEIIVPPGFTWSILQQNDNATFIKIAGNAPAGIYRIYILNEYIDFYFIRISEYYDKIKDDAKNWLVNNWDNLLKSDGDYPGDPADPPQQPPEDASPEEWDAYNKALEDYTKNEIEPKTEEYKKAAHKAIAKAITRILAMSFFKL